MNRQPDLAASVERPGCKTPDRHNSVKWLACSPAAADSTCAHAGSLAPLLGVTALVRRGSARPDSTCALAGSDDAAHAAPVKMPEGVPSLAARIQSLQARGVHT